MWLNINIYKKLIKVNTDMLMLQTITTLIIKS